MLEVNRTIGRYRLFSIGSRSASAEELTERCVVAWCGVGELHGELGAWDRTARGSGRAVRRVGGRGVEKNRPSPLSLFYEIDTTATYQRS